MLYIPTDTRVQFILKARENPYGGSGESYSPSLSSGLKNSVLFVVQMLKDLGVEAEMVIVRDNNDIDREVTRFKPTHVNIEAYWVVPEKFDVLKSLHPSVKWTIRNHSKSEFLANEGMALGWTIGYLRRGIHLACNSPEATRDFRHIAEASGEDPALVSYLPNYYPFIDKPSIYTGRHGRFSGLVVDVGCFGAIRPLKNTLVQAIAAIEFATERGVCLNFHINASRVETGGGPLLKNLRQLFDGLHKKHRLIEHGWVPHEEFLAKIATMDMVLQVSFSETYNIVAADAVTQNVPVVVSDQIPWAPWFSKADPNSARDISDQMHRVYRECKWLRDFRLYWQRKCLKAYNKRSRLQWAEMLSVRNCE